MLILRFVRISGQVYTVPEDRTDLFLKQEQMMYELNSQTFEIIDIHHREYQDILALRSKYPIFNNQP